MKKYSIIFITLMVLGILGCEEEWLDINLDPNVPTIAEPSQLLTGAQTSMGEVFSQGNFIGNGLSSYVHWLVSRENQQYAMAASGTLGNSWQWAYSSIIPNLDVLINEAEETGNTYYSGIAKIMKAYNMSVMVDIFGDVPYSEVNNPEIIHPQPDQGAAIYNSLFALIDGGISDLTNSEASNLLVPGESDDLIYGGDLEKWERLANTLKLRLLVNSRLTPAAITGHAQMLEDLLTDDDFINPGEDFEFWFNASVSPDQRHPAYADEYDGGQITYYISPWFYEIMKGLAINATNNPFEGLDDPRVPYYWFDQLTGGEAAQNPHEYRHEDFVSIVFGSIGPYSDMSQRESASMIGLYPAGGAYDDGSGSSGLGRGDGNGVAPHKFITYASLKFMLAEYFATDGNDAAAARENYDAAVTAAFDHVNKVVDGSGQDVPSIEDAAIEAHVDALLVVYDAADGDGKLEMIMTQKWIHNYFNPVESYADYRRTGYPVLFDATQGTVIIPEDNEGNQSESPTQLIRRYPKSIWYPQREVELNPHITQKSDLSQSPVFWDNRTYDY